MKQITNNHPKQASLSFYNHKTGQIQQDIWTELSEGLWQEFSIENFLHNVRLGATKQTEYRNIFPDFSPIYPGFCWDFERQCMAEELYRPERIAMDKQEFYRRAEAFFEPYRGHKLGVHLSGGLDSSLIICLLKLFDIPFSLYGFSSSHFGFRTERTIQEHLAPLGEKAWLIDMEAYPFYSALDEKAPHQVPNAAIKMIKADEALVQAATDDGIEFMFTGQGADTLFVDAVANVGDLPAFNIGNEFLFSETQDMCYSPKGIELVSFFGDKSIIEALCNLRSGRGDDVQKYWARGFFKDILPRELSDYAYRADFFGTSMSGLELAKPTIARLFRQANELLPHNLFSKRGTEEMLRTNVFDFKCETYQLFCSKVSIAVWLNSLFNN